MPDDVNTQQELDNVGDNTGNSDTGDTPDVSDGADTDSEPLFKSEFAQRLKEESPDVYNNFYKQWTQKNMKTSERLKAIESEREGEIRILEKLDALAQQKGMQNIEEWLDKLDKGELTQEEIEDMEEDIDPKALKQKVDNMEKVLNDKKIEENISRAIEAQDNFRMEIKQKFGEDDLDKYIKEVVPMLKGLRYQYPPLEALRRAYYAAKFPEVAEAALKGKKLEEELRSGEPPMISAGKSGTIARPTSKRGNSLKSLLREAVDELST